MIHKCLLVGMVTLSTGFLTGGALAQTALRTGVVPAPLEPVNGDLTQDAAPEGTRSLRGNAIRQDAAIPRDPRGYYRCDENAVHGAREICLDLTIDYSTTQIYNPLARLEHGRDFDTIRLRSYIPTEDWLLRDPDQPDTPSTRFLAPELRLTPGQTVRLTLRNQLPLPADAEIPGPAGQKCGDLDVLTDMNTPHCVNFNRTNLHSHGLWISPVGNGDNVHISIDAGESFQYEYNIPADHPAGTFWYHSHLHGSTAPQVASGMAGAIIIKGDRDPLPDGDGGWARAGDVDVLLTNVAQDRTILLQQLSYGCRNADGALIDAGEDTWRDCGDETGTVEPGQTAAFDHFSPGSWPRSRRFTSINGAVWPVFGLAAETGEDEPDASFFAPATAGTVERWRLIHAGVRDTVQVQFRRSGLPAETADGSAAEIVAALENAETEALRAAPPAAVEDGAPTRDEVVAAICPEPGAGGGADPLPTFGIASDGLTRDVIAARTDTLMQPGYREDLLVSFPEPGIYCVINSGAPDRTRINAADNEGAPVQHGRDLLGYVIVKPAPEGAETAEIGDLGQLADWLSAQAGQVYGPRIPDQQQAAALIDAIRLGLAETGDDGNARPRLTPFVFHPDVADAEVTDADGALRQRTVAFHLVVQPANSGEPTVGVVPLANGVNFMVGRIGQQGSFEAPQNNGSFAFWQGAAYEHDRIDQHLALDSAEEWWLTSFAAGPHPFHIHVNPFQITSAQAFRPPAGCNRRNLEGGGTETVTGDPRPGCAIVEGNSTTWADLLDPGLLLAADNLPVATEEDPEAQRQIDLTAVAPSQYAGMDGVWKDTLAIENFVLIKMRSRYQRYIGDFVLHCHILDHEDQGMMQNVRISLPVGQSAALAGAGGPAPHDGH